MTDDREPWVFEFVALPDPGGVPPAVRYRRLLKHALRALRLRCRRVRAPLTRPTDGSTTDPPGAAGPDGPDGPDSGPAPAGPAG